MKLKPLIEDVILAVIALALTIGLYIHVHSKEVLRDDLEQSGRHAVWFLHHCEFLRKNWSYAADNVLRENYNIIFLPIKQDNLCAEYLAKRILVYPLSNDRGCYAGRIWVTLAHEMLHQLGLPPHKITPKSEELYKEYLKTDPIELTISSCLKELK